MPINNLITIRKGSESAWISSGAILASGEPGYDVTNQILKIGDGVSTWNNLLNQAIFSDVEITSKLDVNGSGNFSSGLYVNGVVVSVSGHSHIASNITDFNSSVSGILPVKDIIAGTNITLTSNSGIFTINSTSAGGETETIHPFLLGGM